MIRKSKKLPMSGHEIEHSRDKVDRINNLPDCILHHVLSFMPTKEVVKTSVLSTRWKNFWVSVPNLVIDDRFLYAKKETDNQHPLKVASFLNFVKKVLTSRDASILEKCSINCNINSDPSQINSWISDAIMHNVQELDLCLTDVIPSVVPPILFSSVSLTTLKIFIEWINIPSHVSFPSLKTLHLDYVGFLDDDDAERFFSGCLVLDENDRIWTLIPTCMSNSLKIVTFKKFHASGSEKCFLKRVLKYADVLERMDIYWSKTLPDDQRKETEVSIELEMIERSSTPCVFNFS